MTPGRVAGRRLRLVAVHRLAWVATAAAVGLVVLVGASVAAFALAMLRALSVA